MSYLRLLILLVILPGALNVQAQNCSVSTTNLTWGNYNVFHYFPSYSEGTITVNCDGATPYSIRLDPGQNSGGNFSPRKMSSGGHVLNYNIYIDGSHTKIWGDATGGTYVESGVGNNFFSLFGVIPERQIVPPGTYSDTVIITVFW